MRPLDDVKNMKEYFELPNDPQLAMAGIRIGVLAEERDGETGNYILFRRGEKEERVECIHTILYEGSLESMPDVEHPSDTSLDRKRVQLPLDQHFFALKSYVQVLIEMGICRLFTDTPPGDLSFGFNIFMRRQVFQCIVKLAPRAAKTMLASVVGDLLENAPNSQWLQERKQLIPCSGPDFYSLLMDADFVGALSQPAQRRCRELRRTSVIVLFGLFNFELVTVSFYPQGEYVCFLKFRSFRHVVDTVRGDLTKFIPRQVLLQDPASIPQLVAGYSSYHQIVPPTPAQVREMVGRSEAFLQYWRAHVPVDPKCQVEVITPVLEDFTMVNGKPMRPFGAPLEREEVRRIVEEYHAGTLEGSDGSAITCPLCRQGHLLRSKVTGRYLVALCIQCGTIFDVKSRMIFKKVEGTREDYVTEFNDVARHMYLWKNMLNGSCLDSK